MKPSIDHYFGRPFEKVISNEDGESWEWGIQLEGGVLIQNKDKRRTAIPTDEELGGSSLLLTTYGELDTTLHFGKSNTLDGPNVFREVVMTPTLYTIADPAYQGGDEIYPQKVDPEEDVNIPLDPSPERVADGPELPVGASEEDEEDTNG